MNIERRIVLMTLAALGAIGCANNPCSSLHEAVTGVKALKGCDAVIAPYLDEDKVDPDHCPSDTTTEERISCEGSVFLELTDCKDDAQVMQFQADMAACKAAAFKTP
jgi:hypothetical protein